MARLSARGLTCGMTESTREKAQKKTTLVLGGTGKTGLRVAERLTARGRDRSLGRPVGRQRPCGRTEMLSAPHEHAGFGNPL
jgi:NAD(P)-dependent dehydrogenase (short-subunit alcohol dehydrogenase family)